MAGPLFDPTAVAKELLASSYTPQPHGTTQTREVQHFEAWPSQCSRTPLSERAHNSWTSPEIESAITMPSADSTISKRVSTLDESWFG